MKAGVISQERVTTYTLSLTLKGFKLLSWLREVMAEETRRLQKVTHRECLRGLSSGFPLKSRITNARLDCESREREKRECDEREDAGESGTAETQPFSSFNEELVSERRTLYSKLGSLSQRAFYKESS
jgi:hypothetical protein